MNTTPTDAQYKPVQSVPENPDGATVPFTGFDAIALAAVALGTLIVGWALRRASGVE
jgi:hypothetical protein